MTGDDGRTPWWAWLVALLINSPLIVAMYFIIRHGFE
jgi:hypothetical protein